MKGLAETKRGETGDHKLEVAELKNARISFWMDAFKDVVDMEDFSEQAAKLSTKFGYPFKMPAKEQIQNILDALDKAWPVWDRDKPEIFFETLELNFPALLR